MIGSLTAAAAVLLLVSATAKLRNPSAAVPLLTALPLLGRRAPGRLAAAARGVGAGEAVVAVGFLAFGNRISAACLAAAYAAVSIAASVVLASGRRTSCGCFGARSAPIGPAHPILTGACSAVGVAAVIEPVGRAGGLLDAAAPVTALAVVQVVVLAALGYLLLTALPALTDAGRRGAR